MKIQLTLTDGAFMPKKGSAMSAGYDIHSIVEEQIEPNSRCLIKTGVFLKDMPNNMYIRIAPRSGLAVKSSIDVGAGVVDPDYRGEIRVLLINNGNETYSVKEHDRIAQLIFEKFEPDTLLECHMSNNSIMYEEAGDLERGEGGFGSTGR